MNNGLNNLPETAVDMDLFPKEESYSDQDDLNLTLHIKHNWYSEDSEHGRLLLSSFMTTLSGSTSKIGVLLLSGSAVKMLDPTDPLHEELISLSRNSLLTGACVESMEEYSVDADKTSDLQITLYSASDLSFELINAQRLITLE
ncbi:MAG: hypothetical protein J5715_01910 [Clostridiales bacterium]|nr:hypothetical protein [Clostridiales bacterium]MBO4578887.1 hypothetical protein [Clostridiales bacterium]